MTPSFCLRAPRRNRVGAFVGVANFKNWLRASKNAPTEIGVRKISSVFDRRVQTRDLLSNGEFHHDEQSKAVGPWRAEQERPHRALATTLGDWVPLSHSVSNDDRLRIDQDRGAVGISQAALMDGVAPRVLYEPNEK